MSRQHVEDVWRRESRHVLAALLRRHGDLGDCEDALQEAVEQAARQWAVTGLPGNPRGWLVRVASRRLVDAARSDRARRHRESAVAQPPTRAPAADETDPRHRDDSLRLLFLCCHPSLSRPSQVALTLRSVAGLTCAQVAAAFLVPERTMAQRLSRARATLRAAGARFEMPAAEELPERVAAVVDVCHLMFNEGYVRSGGADLADAALAGEAIRLTRELCAAFPDHDEAAGALALMLLTHARSAARTDARGDLVPLAAQDRSLWDRALVREGVAILERILPRGPVGRFQLQAAIAAVHAEAQTWEDTDWVEISMLYDMLVRVAPGPAVTLNRAVAVAMAASPADGLAVLEPLWHDQRMARHHRLHAVHGHLLEMSGDHAAAAAAYRRAAQLTASLPEQRYLNARLRGVESRPPA